MSLRHLLLDAARSIGSYTMNQYANDGEAASTLLESEIGPVVMNVFDTTTGDGYIHVRLQNYNPVAKQGWDIDRATENGAIVITLDHCEKTRGLESITNLYTGLGFDYSMGTIGSAPTTGVNFLQHEVARLEISGISRGATTSSARANTKWNRPSAAKSAHMRCIVSIVNFRDLSVLVQERP